MPKSLTLGNGNILIGFDKYGQIKDFYFPYVGLENHVYETQAHRVGVFVDGMFSWLGPEWEISVECAEDTLAGNISAKNDRLGILISFRDVVYNEKNILIRNVEIKNMREEKRNMKLFFHASFEISESHRGDTAYFDPTNHVLIHYKGRRVFLINARHGKKSFEDYSVGLYELEGKDGTYRDAEDGMLSKNPIEHGRVDSILNFELEIKGGATNTIQYWIVVGKTHEEVHSLNHYVLNKTPDHLLETTQDFWKAWLNKQNFSFYGLLPEVVQLFKKSLVYIRSHSDNRGAIIASSDSDMLQRGRDTYSYMWPRDGAISAIALAKAGDTNVAQHFFKFCHETITEDGYFLHKYQADRSWGSSWHPWIRSGIPTLPIQEDETALVIYALWEHYNISRDLEFVEELYNPLIKKAADFMVEHRDPKSGLPNPSYDLWEEKFGTSTFTASCVYGALSAAARFAELLGKEKDEKSYKQAAEEVRESILKHLYDKKKGHFYKLILSEERGAVKDKTLDMSSIYGIFRFGVLPPDDGRVAKGIQRIRDELCCRTGIEGVPRYVEDAYYRRDPSAPGNPWFITTLWLAQYYIAIAKKEEDLEETKKWLLWCVKHALPSGVLSEQLDPHSGAQISAAPLTWSHSEFVITVVHYLEKLEELGVCKACYPLS